MNDIQKEIKLTRKMYYDYELEQTTGFYPQLSVLPGCYRTINIDFVFLYKSKDVFTWQQSSGPAIYGFTKKNGIALLNSLNLEANVDAQLIVNGGCRIIFPITYNATFYILENYSN